MIRLNRLPPALLASLLALPCLALAQPTGGAVQMLQDLYAKRDERRTVQVVLEKEPLRIGADRLAFRLSASDEGYVYLLMAGSDGKGFDLLFPNKLDQENRISPDAVLTLPRANWALKAQGPEGFNRLLVLVSDTPRDFSNLPLKPSGPFSTIKVADVVAKDIELVFAQPAAASEATCQRRSATRNLVVVRECQPGYGAAMFDVREVR